MKLLTICIPTFNRKDCLIQCLDSIINQPGFPDIEIAISDNASSDGTQSIVQEYITKYPNIVYARNDENIGFDKNILKVVSLASGKYCLFIGDDDAFFEESIPNILELLEKGKADYFLSNNWGYDIGLSYAVTLGPNLSITEDQKFSTLSDFIHSIQPDRIKTVGFFGGMSGQIFLKETWDNFPNKERFIGSQTIHLFVLLSAMKGSSFMLISKPTIKTRADNIRWDTFNMNNAFRREKLTLDAFYFIAQIYNISYSNIFLYGVFLKSYIKNMSIMYIKKYILKDQKTILNIKSKISKFLPHHKL